jgi:hypothetical protein
VGSALRVVLTLAILIGVLVVMTARQVAVECEVCVTHEGRSHCASAAGPTRDRAIEGARLSACSVVSSGVTAGLDCQRRPPTRTTCSE